MSHDRRESKSSGEYGRTPNLAQSEAWNGPESVHYVDHADRYDRQLTPVTDALVERAAIASHEAVLDVGCGSGETALQAAGLGSWVLGVDISDPLVTVAIERARRAGVDNAEFLVADAQIHPFDDRMFDVLISQFGLMFFDDPIAAFSNLRRSLVDGGRIVFSTWQGLAANGWLAPVVGAVERFVEVPDLGGLANGGGMFALKDDSETAALLAEAGFTDVAIEECRPTVVVGGGGTLDESVDFLLGMGIVRGLLGRLDDERRATAVEEVRAELARHHEEGAGVRLGVGVWLVSARR